MPWRHLRDEGHGSYSVAGRALTCALCTTAEFDELPGHPGAATGDHGRREFKCTGCGYVMAFCNLA